MIGQYFSRIYFSRYFYSSFKVNLKTRIKITGGDDQLYFYSDPYYFNKSFKKAGPLSTSAPTRSYFFSVYFQTNLGNRYDLSWQPFFFNDKWLVKFFSIFLKFRVIPFHLTFISIYFNIFCKKFKLTW